MRSLIAMTLALLPVLAASGSETAAAAPCEDAAYRSLDFWLGRWRVETPNGTLAGNSHIESALSGCVVLEHWTGLYLTTGQVQEGLGVHRYDAATRRWRQAWTDDTGAVQDSVGDAENGRVVYAESDAAGTRARMTLMRLPDDRVEQKGERWDDAAQAWQTTFHLVYLRED